MKPETQQRWRCAKIANFVEMVQKRRTARFLPKPFAHQLLVVSSPRPRWFQFSALTLVSKAQALAGVPLVGLVFGVSKKACLASWPWALIVHMYIYIYTSLFTYTNIFTIYTRFLKEFIWVYVPFRIIPAIPPNYDCLKQTFPKKAVKVVVDSKTHYCAACSGTPARGSTRIKIGAGKMSFLDRSPLNCSRQMSWFDLILMICMNIRSNIFTYTCLIYTIDLYAHEPTNVYTSKLNIDKYIHVYLFLDQLYSRYIPVNEAFGWEERDGGHPPFRSPSDGVLIIYYLSLIKRKVFHHHPQ